MTNALNLSRQAILLPPDVINQYTIEAYGVGSVGSHLVKILAKSGFKNIEVFDRDTVEEENIAAQAYDFKHLKMNKVDAIAQVVKEGTGLDIITHHGLVTPDTQIIPQPNTIYYAGFDSLESRKMIFDKVKAYPVIFVDTRIGGYNKRLYFVDCSNPKQVEAYEKTLSSKGVSDLACGEKANAAINCILAGEAVMDIVAYVLGKDYIKIHIGNVMAPATNINVVELRGD